MLFYINYILKHVFDLTLIFDILLHMKSNMRIEEVIVFLVTSQTYRWVTESTLVSL